MAYPSVQGAIIFGNLASYTSDTTNSSLISNIASYPADSGNGTPISYTGKAIGFTMGGSSYTVTTLTLRLNEVNSTTDRPAVSIYTNNGSGAPGTLIGTFSNPATFNGSTPTNYVFSPTSSIELYAGSSYFIVVQQLNLNPQQGDDNLFKWQNGVSTVIPSGIASNPLARFGSAGTTSPTAMTSSSGQYNWFQLEGNVVPEPTSAAFGLISTLMLLRRRR